MTIRFTSFASTCIRTLRVGRRRDDADGATIYVVDGDEETDRALDAALA